MRTPSIVLALALLLPAAGRAQDATAPVVLASPEVFQAVSQFYAYDRAAPLDAQVVARQETPTYVREKVVFSGVDGLRVPGYLAIPKTRSSSRPGYATCTWMTG